MIPLSCSAGSSGPDNLAPPQGHDASEESLWAPDARDASEIEDAGHEPEGGDSSQEPVVEADTASEDSAPATLTGLLVGGTGAWPGGISGVRYHSGSQQGVTDASGTFSYEAGKQITFGVSDVEFRAADGAAMISPWQLSAQGLCTQTDELKRLLVLLQSLDDDNDPATGTHISSFPLGTPLRPFSSLTDGDVATLIDKLIPGRTPGGATDALHRYITQMDGELWKQLSSDVFDSTTSAIRSQGVTTDSANWYFSWRLGLEKTDLSLNTVMKNNLAIPPALALQGSDHIGDIDLWNGTLYAPIEDSQAYKSPKVVLFDTDLNAGKVFSLPNTLLTKGVPWVAVDGARSSVYVAEWDPTPAVYVFALADMTYQQSIPLSVTIGRIQGAKVFEGALYANVDDAAKSIDKINLETGTVIGLFTLNESMESEGIAFLQRSDGSLMHTLNTTANATKMEFRHHERTREPLRKQVCP